MHVNSAENMGHNLPLLEFSMTGLPPQVHHNNHQRNVTENIQVNQSNNHFIRNHTNQPLSPSLSTLISYNLYKTNAFTFVPVQCTTRWRKKLRKLMIMLLDIFEKNFML